MILFSERTEKFIMYESAEGKVFMDSRIDKWLQGMWWRQTRSKGEKNLNPMKSKNWTWTQPKVPISIRCQKIHMWRPAVGYWHVSKRPSTDHCMSVVKAKNINNKFMRKIVKGNLPFSLLTRHRTFSSSHKFTCFPNIFDILLPLKIDGKEVEEVYGSARKAENVSNVKEDFVTSKKFFKTWQFFNFGKFCTVENPMNFTNSVPIIKLSTLPWRCSINKTVFLCAEKFLLGLLIVYGKLRKHKKWR